MYNLNKIIFIIFLFITSLLYSKKEVSISFVGDIMLAYEMDFYIKQYGITYPFLETFKILKSSDISIGNLECPISYYGTPIQNKSFYFKAKPKTIESLVFAGFDIMNLANNHILDFGTSAFFQTINILTNNNILYIGVGKNKKEAEKLKIINRNGFKIGFLGFNLTNPSYYYATKTSPGTATCSKKKLKNIILKNKCKVDFLVIIFHWGKEYSESPTKKQKKLARFAIDTGADIVVGHHPHILQPIETYKNKIIAYSLGNFAFGTYGYPPKKIADKSIILTVYFNKKGFIKAKIIPINVFNYDVVFQPKIEKDEKAIEILNHIKNLSMPFNTKIRITNNIGIIE